MRMKLVTLAAEKRKTEISFTRSGGRVAVSGTGTGRRRGESWVCDGFKFVRSEGKKRRNRRAENSEHWKVAHI